MLYTGLSRTRTELMIYGDDAVLKHIARTPAPARNSGLVERVRAMLDDEEDDAESEAARAPVPRAA